MVNVKKTNAEILSTLLSEINEKLDKILVGETGTATQAEASPRNDPPPPPPPVGPSDPPPPWADR